MAFRLGGKAFSHANGSLIATPQEGKAAFQQFRFTTVKSLDFDNNLKAVLFKGFTNAPSALVAGDAEPEWKFGIDVGQEGIDYLEFCGDGCNIIEHQWLLLFQRPGVKTIRFEFLTCIVEKGFGMKSEAGGGPNTEFSGKNRKTLVNGVDPLVLGPGGSGGGGGGGGLSASLNLGPLEIDLSLKL